MSRDGAAGAVIELTLTIPASSEHIRFARLMASAAATKFGFDYDTVEDLRIGVSELCTAVAETCQGDGSITLRYFADGDGGIRIDGEATFQNGIAIGTEREELIDHILDAVADEHRIDLGPTGGSFMLRMGAVRAPGP